MAILRNANLNPNDHMTDSQKILLQRAQYFDQLNQLAYFPGGVPPAQGAVNVLDEGQQQQLAMLQAQQMQGDQQPGVNYQPGDHYERVGGSEQESPGQQMTQEEFMALQAQQQQQ